MKHAVSVGGKRNIDKYSEHYYSYDKLDSYNQNTSSKVHCPRLSVNPNSFIKLQFFQHICTPG